MNHVASASLSYNSIICSHLLGTRVDNQPIPIKEAEEIVLAMEEIVGEVAKKSGGYGE